MALIGRRAIASALTAAVLYALLVLNGGPAPSPVPVEPDAPGAVTIQITAPSAEELTIAPGRHFKVAGTLTGEVPDDAVLRVSLLDATGREVRHAEARQKGTGLIVEGSVGGDMTIFAAGTAFSEVAYTAPELAVADADDPAASAHDATVKCVYTADTFYALIVSATDTAHGLAEADGYNLVDHEGNPYDALPEGTYTVRVTLTSASGQVLGSASEDMVIGRTAGTVIHEVTSSTVIRKGGLELVKAWAAKDNLTVLDDLLPGMFGIYYQMSTMPLAVSCETAEYLSGPIHMLVYGNRATSTSYALEVAKYLQLEGTVEDPSIAFYYLFSLGEPSFGGERAEIVSFDPGESMRICRVDHVDAATQDGVFLTTEAWVLGSDTDASDGWTAGDGAFAIAGVMKPYQLAADEIVPDGSIYGYYTFLNGADTLIFTFAPADGTDAFAITKAVGVSRIDDPDKTARPALLEFYSVFSAGTLQTDMTYDVTVQAYDRNGAAIDGMACAFTLAME